MKSTPVQYVDYQKYPALGMSFYGTELALCIEDVAEVILLTDHVF